MIRILRTIPFVAVLCWSCAKPPTVDADLIIRQVTVIDGTGAAAKPDQTVAIKDGRIVAIGATSEFRTADSAVVVDGRGKYLIPGLWDMHVHLDGYGESSFPLFLANGVTGVRDMGSNLAASLKLREAARTGAAPAPEVLIAGLVLDSEVLVQALAGTSYEAGRAAVPDSASGARMVDSLVRAGVDHIKVHSLTPRAAYFAIIAEAKRRGIPVVGHVPDSVSLREAILAGQHTIEHGSRLEFEETPRGEALAAAWLAGTQRLLDQAGARPRLGPIFALRLAMADSALAAFDSATAAAFGAFAAQHQVWFDPTLAVIETLHRANDSAYRHPAELKYVPRSAVSEEIPFTTSATPAELEAGRARLERQLTSVRPLVRSGARFITGTDMPVPPSPPGFSLLRELELLAQAGLSPMQVLQAATRNSAEAAGKLAELGTVERGKWANMVLLDADPLADIGHARRVNAVIVKGRLLDRSALDRMLTDAATYAATH